MKSSEATILVIAGHTGAGEVHWQRRLISRLSSAQLVEQPDWLYGSLAVAIDALAAVVAAAPKPVVLIAHSAGCALVAHAVLQMDVSKIRGAFLVAAPSEASLRALDGIDPAFAYVPRDPLPFPSLLVASTDDPYCTMEEATDLASAWGSQLVEAGAAGHINTASGHGPWPEGMMRFAGFLSKLAA
jgi:uncharacterized protein